MNDDAGMSFLCLSTNIVNLVFLEVFRPLIIMLLFTLWIFNIVNVYADNC